MGIKNFLKDEGLVTLGMKDSSVKFDMAIDEVTGFLTVDAVIARTGIQKYLNSELGDEGTGIVGVYRPVEEVTSDESLNSFINVPVTNEHPTEMVTVDNVKKYGKGSISNVNVVQLDGESALKTILTITDKDLIANIQSGKKELSVGYTNVLVQKDGTYKGEDYKYIQTDIIANHVAVVDAGRCGGICSLMLDAESNKNEKDEYNMKIIINGTEFEVEEALAAEIEKLKASSEKMEDMEEEVKESLDRALKANDKLTAKYDLLKKDTKSYDSVIELNDAVAQKIELITFAKDCKLDVKVTDANLDIKKAIVKSFDMDITDKSETYLDAAIDMKMVEMKDKGVRQTNALDSIKSVGTDYKPTTNIDVDAIGDKEMGAK